MIAKTLGILLLIAGAAVVITGISGVVDYAQGETVNVSTVAVRMAAGMFLIMGGAFTSAFAFQSQLTRGVTTIFKRLRGTRIDEEIARLAKLRGDGYITGEEYEAAKKKLLDDL